MIIPEDGRPDKWHPPQKKKNRFHSSSLDPDNSLIPLKVLKIGRGIGMTGHETAWAHSTSVFTGFYNVQRFTPKILGLGAPKGADVVALAVGFAWVDNWGWRWICTVEGAPKVPG